MNKSKPSLAINEIQDIYSRQNFKNLKEYFEENNQLYDFEFYEVNFDGTETTKKIKHGLGYIPNDIIVTRITGTDVSFDIGLFTKTEIQLTCAGESRIRFFVGSYWNKQSKEENEESDSMIVSSGESAKTDNQGWISGEIKMWPGSVLPENSLLCDGTQYDAKKYPKIAKALWDTQTKKYAFGGIGTYPNGSFNVPDMRGLVPRGVAGTSTQDPNKDTRTALSNGNGNVGNNVGSYQADGVGPHSHSITTTNAWGNLNSGPGGRWSRDDGTAGSNTVGTDTWTGPTETRMKNVYVNYIIMI